MFLGVVIDGVQQPSLGPGDVLRVGRHPDPSLRVVGLDPDDTGISRLSVMIELGADGWLLTNVSAKTTSYVDRGSAGAPAPLRPGDRYLVTGPTGIEIRGQIHRHRIELTPSGSGASVGSTQLPGAETDVAEIEYSEADRDALTALFRGYLEQFPRRDCHPLSYRQAGELLGVPASTVRRRIEHLRERLAAIDVYIEGPNARQELAAYVLELGVIGPDDLARLGRP